MNQLTNIHKILSSSIGVLFFVCSGALVFAAPAITIDGTTYTDYAMLSTTKTGSYVYSTFESVINAPNSTIIIDNGTFTVNKRITFRRNNTQIIGISRDTSKIVQTNPNSDLFQVYANDVLVKNITFDTKTYNAYGAFVVGDGVPGETIDETKVGNRISLIHCNILGGNRSAALYFAGPTYKTSIYNRYEQNQLSDGNQIIDNYMEGSPIRDTFVFALQKNGIMKNNTLVGGELDVYMNNSTTIESNTIKNSNKTGIYLSGPSKTLTLTGNIIQNTQEHGITSFYQIDNIPIPDDMRFISNSIISNNTITDVGEDGLGLNYFISGSVINNTITRAGVHGIALVSESSQNIVLHNTITDAGIAARFRGSGIFITVSSSNNTVSNNTINLASKYKAYAGIFIETRDCLANLLQLNTISGKFTYAGIYSYGDSLILDRNSAYNQNGDSVRIIP